MQDFVCGECSTNKRVDNHIVEGAAEAAFVGQLRFRIIAVHATRDHLRYSCSTSPGKKNRARR